MSPNNVLWLWSLSVKVSGTQNFHLNYVNYMVNTPYDILQCVIDVSPNNVLRLQRIGIDISGTHKFYSSYNFTFFKAQVIWSSMV